MDGELQRILKRIEELSWCGNDLSKPFEPSETQKNLWEELEKDKQHPLFRPALYDEDVPPLVYSKICLDELSGMSVMSFGEDL